MAPEMEVWGKQENPTIVINGCPEEACSEQCPTSTKWVHVADFQAPLLPVAASSSIVQIPPCPQETDITLSLTPAGVRLWAKVRGWNWPPGPGLQYSHTLSAPISGGAAEKHRRLAIPQSHRLGTHAPPHPNFSSALDGSLPKSILKHILERKQFQ